MPKEIFMYPPPFPQHFEPGKCQSFLIALSLLLGVVNSSLLHAHVCALRCSKVLGGAWYTRVMGKFVRDTAGPRTNTVECKSFFLPSALDTRAMNGDYGNCYPA